MVFTGHNLRYNICEVALLLYESPRTSFDRVGSREVSCSCLRDLACDFRDDKTPRLPPAHDLATERRVTIDTVVVESALDTSLERPGGLVGLEAGGGGLSTLRRMFCVKVEHFDLHVVDR